MLEAAYSALLAVVAVAIVWFAVFAVLKLYQGQR